MTQFLHAIRPTAPQLKPGSLNEVVDKTLELLRPELDNRGLTVKTKLPSRLPLAPLDLTQMQPRGHYARNPRLQRYFRAMSWMGMAAFPIEGEKEDAAAIALLARVYLGSGVGQKSLGRVLDLTAFFVGGVDAAGLGQASGILSRSVPGAARTRWSAPSMRASKDSTIATPATGLGWGVRRWATTDISRATATRAIRWA